MKKNKRWKRVRHGLVTRLAYAVLYPYSRLKYGITVRRFKEQKKGQAYLIAMNHQTAFDQFFVGMAFYGPVYYLASEDLFSKGWISNLIRWLVAPIPIKKQTLDASAVKTCIRVAREGGTIALAPEGNRTYSGKTAYIKPSIAKFVRKLRLPLALFRIEGGYGVHPRWSDVVRKGKMTAGVSRVIEPEEYDTMTDDELFAVIEKELYVNEAVADGEFRHSKSAEYLERALYVCPYCGIATLESHGDTVTCRTCGRQVRYLPTKELEGVGEPFPFRFVADWYDYQCEFVHALDLTQYLETPIGVDMVTVERVILYQRKEKWLDTATLSLYGDRMEIVSDATPPLVYRFDELPAVTILGKNKLNVYVDGENVFQIIGDKRFNALKYLNMFHHYQNVREGNRDGEFLGL